MKKGDHFVMCLMLLDLVVLKMSTTMPIFLASVLTTPLSLAVKFRYQQMLSYQVHTEGTCICVNTLDANVDFGFDDVITQVVTIIYKMNNCQYTFVL